MRNAASPLPPTSIAPPVTRTDSPPYASSVDPATTLISCVLTSTRRPPDTVTSSALTSTPSTADTDTLPPADTDTSIELTLTSSPADASIRHSDDTDTAPDARVPKCIVTLPHPSNVGPTPGSLRTRTPATACRLNRTLRPPSE